MAVQQFTGSEIGNEFINKLNHNLEEGSGARAIAIRMERGGLKSTGAMDYTIASFNGYVRSSMLIKVNNATSVRGLDFHAFKVYEYGESFNILSTNTSEGDTFNSSCKYIKICKQTSDAVAERVMFIFNGDVEEVYNVQIEKGLFTSGSLNGKLKSEMLVFEVSEGICTTGRLLLPPNYGIKGEKVPLIIWCVSDGGWGTGGGVDDIWNCPIDASGSYPGGSRAFLTTQLQYLADEGFAVLAIYPWCSRLYEDTNCRQGNGAIPIPVTLRAHEKAVEYVTSRFNISDTNIFQCSHSGGGKLSSYYAIHMPNFNLRAIYAFNPVVDGLCFRQWSGLNFRRALHREMNFADAGNRSDFLTGTWPISGSNYSAADRAASLVFIKANAEKFAKCAAVNWQNLSGQTIDEKVADTIAFGQKFWDESYWNKDWANITHDIYNRYDLSIFSNGAPITIIAAPNDDQCPYMAMEEFIIQLRNGGGEANIVTLERVQSNPHSASIFQFTEQVTPRYSSTAVAVPIGWRYMVADIYARFMDE